MLAYTGLCLMKYFILLIIDIWFLLFNCGKTQDDNF